MSDLRRRMTEDLQLKNRSERTQIKLRWLRFGGLFTLRQTQRP